MINHGEEPNLATLAILLTTCIHTGLLEESQLCLYVLRRVYDIIPSLEHFTCMIDLFSRTGCLDKAVKLIKVMPFSPNLLVWNTMLGACWKLGDPQLRILVFEYKLQLMKMMVQHMCACVIFMLHKAPLYRPRTYFVYINFFKLKDE